jgi:hypothetical protein
LSFTASCSWLLLLLLLIRHRWRNCGWQKLLQLLQLLLLLLLLQLLAVCGSQQAASKAGQLQLMRCLHDHAAAAAIAGGRWCFQYVCLRHIHDILGEERRL